MQIKPITKVGKMTDSSDQIKWTDTDQLIKPERHNDTITIISDRGGAEHRSLNDLLSFYLHTNRIDYHQHHAGNKFYRLWFYTCLRDRYVTSRYNDEPKSNVDAHDLAIIPYEFIEAKFAINDPFARMAVIDVCCHNLSPGKRKMNVKRYNNSFGLFSFHGL